jgi:hypothetical protein
MAGNHENSSGRIIKLRTQHFTRAFHYTSSGGLAAGRKLGLLAARLQCHVFQYSAPIGSTIDRVYSKKLSRESRPFSIMDSLSCRSFGLVHFSFFARSSLTCISRSCAWLFRVPFCSFLVLVRRK